MTRGAADPIPPGTSATRIDIGRRIAVWVAHSAYRLDVLGLERVPATGPVLFVSNHSSAMDGPTLFALLPRRVSFLVKAEMFHGFVGWVLTTVGQYGLHRQKPDRAPLLAALDQLRSGGAIGVFPEGTRGEGGVDNVFNGAGWLACRAGATVVPVAIRGTRRPQRSRWRFRPRVRILIGEPFDVPLGAGRAAMTAATDEIRGTLRQLVSRLDSSGRGSSKGR